MRRGTARPREWRVTAAPTTWKSMPVAGCGWGAVEVAVAFAQSPVQVRLAPWTHHFTVHKAAVGVLLQGDDDRVKDVLNTCDLDVLLAANKVLVHCFEPPRVVMAVGDDVHVDSIVSPARAW